LKFTPQKIADLIIIEPKVHNDGRGYFMETFRHDLLEEFLDRRINFVQDSESKSTKGVLRGLHFQLPPYSQSKLVRVVEGGVLDVAVDVRRASPTFGQYLAVELTAENKLQLFVPHGFAHGFVVLSDKAIFSYKVDNYYSPDHERGIAFDDRSLAIHWQLPLEQLHVSVKDNSHPSLHNAIDLFE
jgi:dTDP-4-dehydrorhamnose 3,5-epimerase